MVEMVAEVAHEANRVYCASIGDFSQVPWNATRTDLKESTRQGVRNIMEGVVTGPAQSHESWVAYKTAEGWQYGPEKSLDAKTHPCMLPWDMLPKEQRAKDVLYCDVVHAMLRVLHFAHCVVNPYGAI